MRGPLGLTLGYAELPQAEVKERFETTKIIQREAAGVARVPKYKLLECVGGSVVKSGMSPGESS